MRIVYTILFVLLSSYAYSQYTNRPDHDVKVPSNEEMDKRCGELTAMVANLPPEVRFQGMIEGDSVFFACTSEKYFWQFFPGKNDGFFIDIINKDQFQCDNIQRISLTSTHKGFMLEPVYRDDMKKRMKKNRHGWAIVFAGLVPRKFDKTKIEANYSLIRNQYQCSYTANVNVASHGWNLLPMGLYYDTLYKESMAQRYRDIEKTMHFTIPFQKNTSVYKKEDIKPLYDSLKLTDFEITAIKIKAFTSVEGTLKRNIELQDERAQSIVDALQTFQPETIKSEIISAENWVEFLESINGTSYSNMISMTKEQVKEALKDPQLASKLEPALAKERKAIIELKLEKRISYNKSSPAELKKLFDQSIATKNINEALYLQDIIFHKIRREQLPLDFLHSLEIPQAIEYGSLLLNNESFLYEYDNENIFDALHSFMKLRDLLGNNEKVDYNICALRIKIWLQTRILDKEDGDLKSNIESLKKRGIPEMLVLRLMVNYSLVQTEVLLREHKYKEREQWLNFIMNTYQKISVTDSDLLSLAHFLSHNSRYDWAEKILFPRMKDINVSADILFYYLSLTIFDSQLTETTSYRTIMLNAVNVSRTRFCHIFDPIPQDGVSFQLLEDAELKKTWCENCNLPR